MPLYNNAFPPYSVAPGEETSGASNLLNAEQLQNAPGFGANTNFSQRVAITDPYGLPPRPIVLNFTYGSTPASVQYDIYAAWDDTAPLTSYTKIDSTNNVAGDQVTIQRGAAGGNQFRFLCVREVISPGVNATVKVQQ